MISKYKEYLQLLYIVNELCVTAFIGPDGMGEEVDDFNTMSDCYYLTV